ncbi:two-component regulator propeller domain-containing protein, partial [Candidatus Neomarinimicrobiota bacterium]
FLSNGLLKINGASYEKVSKVGTDLIIEDPDGKIWFGGKKLCSYDGNNVIEYSKKELGGKKITALHYDNSGNMWIGTKNGVSVYDGKGWKIFKNVSNCPTKSVNSIISDSKENTWIGAKDGVFKYDGNNWQHFTVNDGLVTDGTLILRDHNNTIYAIAGKPEKEGIGIVVVDFGIGLNTALAKSGLSIYENGSWMAFNNKKEVPTDIYPVFFEDKSGNLWFNSKEKIIYKFDGMTWTSYAESNGFSSNHFNTMLEDSKGNYWFGLSGTLGRNGIGKFDGQNWSYFNKESGLPSNIISSILEDKNGNIWFGTLKGVAKYTP